MASATRPIILTVEWWAIKKTADPPTEWATFGFHRVGILAGLANNVSLIAVSFYILYEAYFRFLNPQNMILAAIGLVISAVIVYLVNDRARHNLNIRSVWLHFAGETLASLGVLIGGILITFTGWFWIDTLLSAILGLTILRGTSVILRDIIVILLEGTPANISIKDISQCIKQIRCVAAARDIHV